MPGPEIQFLTINHDKFIRFPDASSKGSSGGPSRLSSGSSSQPRSKSARTFDLASLSEQLPPNTGPPGTVLVNGSSGSGTNANKNLSHVPCKFFRQGNCQAGNSCPFSHNLDGSLAADKLPCKYFQKGNCKFGLKCALAHFLPDGTRVNSKSLNSSFRRQERNHEARNQESGSSGTNGSGSLESTSAPSSLRSRGSFNSSASAGAGQRNGSQHGGSDAYFRYGASSNSDRFPVRSRPSAQDLPPLNSFDNHASSFGDSSKSYLSEPINIKTLSYGEQDLANSGSAPRGSFRNSSSSTLCQTQPGPRSRGISLSNASGNFSSHQDWSVNGGLSSNAFTTSNSFSATMRSFTSTSPTTLVSSPASIDFSSNILMSSRTESPTDQFGYRSQLASSATSNFFMSPPHQNVGISNESAISDGSQEEDALEDDENAFFEDYVPASLGNLILTPQERQRRDSRSQSGTLWVRPTIERSQSASKKRHASGHDNDVFLMD